MEEWNIGMMGKKNRMLKPMIPSFQHSSGPLFLLCGLRVLSGSILFFIPGGYGVFIISYAMKKPG